MGGNFGGGASKPTDGFARVTWTDLASGKAAYGNAGGESRQFVRPGSRGGRPSLVSP